MLGSQKKNACFAETAILIFMNPAAAPTIAHALEDARKRLSAAGIETAALDAEILLAEASERTRIELMMDGNDPLPTPQQKKFESLIKRRLQHEPVAYILGEKEFWSLPFDVNKGVLIPRPDSETLVATLMVLLSDKTIPFTLADLGVGSGALVISLLKEYPAMRGFGVDVAETAIRTTAANAHRHEVADRLTLYRGKWAEPLEENMNVIISNPPYIPTADLAGLMEDVREWEPVLALDGGADGLDAYRALIPSAYGKLAPGGLLLLEIGIGQCEQVCALLPTPAWAQVRAFKDISGHERVIAAVKGNKDD